MKIREFGVEIWMNRYETRCQFNLAETCVASLTFGELLQIAGKTDDILAELSPIRLDYGAIEGSGRLRALIAELYDTQAAENILVTHGAIGANALVHETLVEPGDRVISVLPTYQQHYSIPESYGADVQILRLHAENGFLPDLKELEKLAIPGTRLIAINNPNNPTGSLMNDAFLKNIAAIAERCGAWVLCDEVYRGTDHAGDGFTSSIVDLYARGISTGSMSKTYALAGLRLGWIAAPTELIHAASIHRDYNTISVGVLNDYIAAMALEHRAEILARSHHIIRDNLAVLEQWIDTQPLISWVKPQSGTTALLRYDIDMPSEDFCVQLVEQTGVMLTPGSALDMEGYVRIGYANSQLVLTQGLQRLSAFLSAKTMS
jgi:aspartate/methionine/tyrosine aminotransferase